MEVSKHTPYELFHQAQRFVVPLFQRPYVWTELAQWRPFWNDIERLSLKFLRDPDKEHRPHFLGAIVLQQQQTSPQDLNKRIVIDGQQRLTTLQILIDAAHSQIAQRGLVDIAANLLELNENPERKRKQSDDRFKLLPMNRDQASYLEVMSAEPPVRYSTLVHKDELIQRAHQFFSAQVGEFLDADGSAEIEHRAIAVEGTISKLLRVVSINLEAGENAQEIFETLNSRGTPLSPADLIKNFLFQQLDVERSDVGEMYQKYWKIFEEPFWEQQISVGRRYFPRSAIFLAHFLVSRTGEVTKTEEVFQRFKEYAFDSGFKASVLVQQLHDVAKKYGERIQRAMAPDGSLDGVETFLYRTQTMDVDIVKPILIQLLDPALSKIPGADIDHTLACVESWLIRRGLLRLTAKRYGMIVADLVAEILKCDRQDVGVRVEQFLSTQMTESDYWPDDEEMTKFLATAPLYKRLSSSRRRLVLEALEDDLRGFGTAKSGSTEQRCPRGSLSVEHILPRAWKTSWPLQDGETEDDRVDRVDRIGNLTLLTQKLNSSVSNGPWDGDEGKRKALGCQSILKLNAVLNGYAVGGWNHSSIDNRTTDLIGRVLRIWPVPKGHRVVLREVGTSDSVSVSITDLISVNLLEIGTVLVPRSKAFQNRIATVMTGGKIVTDDGKVFLSPSGAARHVLNAATAAGWHFWLVGGTQVRLWDLREQFRAEFSVDDLEDVEDEDDDS